MQLSRQLDKLSQGKFGLWGFSEKCIQRPSLNMIQKQAMRQAIISNCQGICFDNLTSYSENSRVYQKNVLVLEMGNESNYNFQIVEALGQAITTTC